MNTLSRFAIGFAAGLLAYHFFLTTPNSPPAPAAPQVHRETAEAKPTHAAQVKVAPRKIESNIPAQTAQPPERAPAATPKKMVALSLTEDVIRNIEEQWNDLPQLAEAVRELRGWRIVRVETGSVFAKTGLKQGDLVTTEFLENLRTSHNQATLALRVEQVLNRITR